jgi:hypothetical protein
MGFSGRDVILFIGGLFLLYKATTEIHNKLEGEEEDLSPTARRLTSGRPSSRSSHRHRVLLRLHPHGRGPGGRDHHHDHSRDHRPDGDADLRGKISGFINNHPTIKMLALAFLVMIGVLLVAEAFEFHVPKGYVYFSMAFSLGVEMLNLRMKRASPYASRRPTRKAPKSRKEPKQRHGTAKPVPRQADGRRRCRRRR